MCVYGKQPRIYIYIYIYITYDWNQLETKIDWDRVLQQVP